MLRLSHEPSKSTSPTFGTKVMLKYFPRAFLIYTDWKVLVARTGNCISYANQLYELTSYQLKLIKLTCSIKADKYSIKKNSSNFLMQSCPLFDMFLNLTFALQFLINKCSILPVSCRIKVNFSFSFTLSAQPLIYTPLSNPWPSQANTWAETGAFPGSVLLLLWHHMLDTRTSVLCDHTWGLEVF